MPVSRSPQPEEVETLLLNARLRDELEPYCDEAYECLNMRQLSTAAENEFLVSMLAWECVPVLPISRWFEPEMRLPSPDRLSEGELRDLLWQTVHRLFEKRIVLDFTDHLSDRELYALILRDILPSYEKKLDLPDQYLHWDCSCDTETYLRYYATEEERHAWVGGDSENGDSENGDSENGDGEFGPLPPQESPPHRRQLPRRPL